jgi:hypothetical protein
VQFTVRGKEWEITKELVEAGVKDVVPKYAQRWGARINGCLYPVKQAMSTIGLGESMITSQDAIRILTKLGFEIEDRNHPNGFSKKIKQNKSTMFQLMIQSALHTATNQELAMMCDVITAEMIRRMK